MAFTKALFVGVLIAYPLIVYFGLDRFEARTIAIVLIALALLRIIALRQVKSWSDSLPSGRFVVFGLLLVCGLVVVSNSPEFLRYYPVIMNVVMFSIFFTSILYPPTVIERIARVRTPDLPETGVRYTRKVTMVWSAFFLLNGAMALYTSMNAGIGTWAVYNGFVSYFLMGILFVGEYFVRRHVKARMADNG